MNIGIDIDGVLTDIEQWQLDYASEFYYEKYNMDIINPNGYYTNEFYNMPTKYDDEFWAEYFKDYSLNIEARKFASEVIEKLKNDGNTIYIITARCGYSYNSKTILTDEESNQIVKNWLKEHKIYYDKLIFSPEDKLEICKENNINLMIEDKPENINTISKHIPVICFNARYNEQCNGKNIIRCYSWYDIYAKIKKIVSK